MMNPRNLMKKKSYVKVPTVQRQLFIRLGLCTAIACSMTVLKAEEKGESQKSLPRVRVKVPFPEVIKTLSTGEQITSLRRAVADIQQTFPESYDGNAYLERRIPESTQ